MAQKSKRENPSKNDKSLEELLKYADNSLLQWNNKILPYTYQTTEKKQQELFDEYRKEHPIENSDNKQLKERNTDTKKKSTANNDFQNKFQDVKQINDRLFNQQDVIIQKLQAENEKLKAEKEQYEKLYNDKNNKWRQQAFVLSDRYNEELSYYNQLLKTYTTLKKENERLKQQMNKLIKRTRQQKYQSVLPIIPEEPNIQNIKVDVLDLIKKGYIRGDEQMLNQKCCGRLLKDRYQKIQEHKKICPHHPVITLPTLYTGYGRTNIYK